MSAIGVVSSFAMQNANVPTGLVTEVPGAPGVAESVARERWRFRSLAPSPEDATGLEMPAA